MEEVISLGKGQRKRTCKERLLTGLSEAGKTGQIVFTSYSCKERVNAKRHY